MMKHLIVFVFVLFGSMAISLASDFKLNQESLDTKFDNSVEVSIENFSYFSLQDKELATRPINQNIAGVLAICCGTFGVHRFYMGHLDAGIKHLAFTVLTGLMAGTAIYIINFSGTNGGGALSSDVALGLAFASYVIAYCGSGAHGVYSLVEGIIYLVMPEERFQGKIVKDPRFFASFNRN
jgi:TM2 domain-containing membrane protein YozV